MTSFNERLLIDACRAPRPSFRAIFRAGGRLAMEGFANTCAENIADDALLLAVVDARRYPHAAWDRAVFMYRKVRVCAAVFKPTWDTACITLLEDIVLRSKVDVMAKVAFLRGKGAFYTPWTVRTKMMHADAAIRRTFTAISPLVLVHLLRVPPRVQWRMAGYHT